MEIVRNIFTFKKRELITPHFIRITLSGDVTNYLNCSVGANNKLFIPIDGSKEVIFPGEKEEGTFVKPAVRTYTHRGIDPEKNEMMIDFVNHGENGPASRWAIKAEVGDPIGVAMKAKETTLFPKADYYFLIGDSTAIPVISVILETLPKEAVGKVILEVPGPLDEQTLVKPEGMEILWLHNSAPENGSEIAPTVRETPLPSTGSTFAYIAAEFSTVKDLRIYFRKELNFPKEALTAFSYWRAGIAEDQSAQQRQQERASIE